MILFQREKQSVLFSYTPIYLSSHAIKHIPDYYLCYEKKLRFFFLTGIERHDGKIIRKKKPQLLMVFITIILT